MNTVAKFCGVKSMAVDGDKGTLTVVGAVDVVRVAKALRKAGFEAHVLSVGPEEEKKPDSNPAKKPDEAAKLPPPPTCCAGCSACCPPAPAPVPVAPFPGAVVCYDERPAGNGCAIL
ncbi:heavy metal-associated isoprenylated plant protein 43 [Setaria italica]|nr:heavy metal-associated isoprenylated plant protein 43 [Setaria italica]